MELIIEHIQTFWINLQQGQLPQLGPWNYLLLAVLMVWQGPIATLLGGAAASAGLLKPGLVFLVGVLGNLSADIIWYSVGRRGNVERFFAEGARLGGHKRHFLRFKNSMNQHATKVLLLAKLSAGLAVPALLTAGVTRLRWRKWFPIVFIGETIWTGTLVLIGYFATEAIKQVEQGLEIVLVVTIFILIALFIYFIPRIIGQDDKYPISPKGVSATEEKKIT